MRAHLSRAALAGFQTRTLQDALASAFPTYWERRAEVWEWARPQPSDFNGQATRDELVDRDIRCRDTAAACRAHAHVLRTDQTDSYVYEVTAVLAEVA